MIEDTGRGGEALERPAMAGCDRNDEMTDRSDKAYLISKRVCERYGIVPMTLQRWVRDERLDFPQPMVIGHRWYFRIGALEEWEQRQVRQ